MQTDRSRIEAFQVCPRLRYLTYHHQGRGLVPKGAAWELTFGIVWHLLMDQLLRGTAPEEAIAACRQVLRDAIPDSPPTPQFEDEQRYLFEVLAWAFVRVRLPFYQQTFDRVLSEQELAWPLGPDLEMMTRLDALLREKATGTLWMHEWKTTSYGDDRWRRQFEHNAQMMSGLLSCEAGLFERPAGVLVEGVLKGPRRFERTKASRYRGVEIQDSPCCYVYESGAGELQFDWSRSAIRVGVWETVWTPKRWAEEFLSEEMAQSFFIQVDPVTSDRWHLERWRFQTTVQEARIRDTLRLVRDPQTAPEQATRALEETFPLHETSCAWQYGKPCAYWVLCHERGALDRASEHGFVPRTPNHSIETLDNS